MSGRNLTDVVITSPRAGAPRFRSYRVEVVEGPDAGRSVRLERGSLVIGSARDADLSLSDGAVSRAHARLVPFPDGVEVTDLESKNGTFVAGARIAKARVPAGSELVVGRSRVRLVPEDEDAVLEPSERTEFGRLHGRSRPMRELFALLELVADKDSPVLFEGEPGVGKKRAAESLHAQSPRRAGRVHVLLAEAAGADDVLPDELPTNVTTLLIDHVDALSPGAQARLADAVDRRSLGARYLATTCKDLDREVAAGRFDRRLAAALGVVRVRVPPLRERASDLPVLIDDLLAELGHPSFDLGPADLGRMQAYAWPDNVRELRAVIERAVLLDRPSLSPGAAPGAPAALPPGADAVVGADLPYKQARSQMIEAFEREYVRSLLAKHDGNVSRAARAAGIDRVYLHRLIKKYEL